MTNIVQKMTHAALVERLRVQSRELLQAAADGDLEQVARLDHALRSTAIALVGGASLVEDDSDERVTALKDALLAVREAALILERKTKQDKPRGTLVYLDMERKNRK